LAGIIDSEMKIDPDWLEQTGVDTKNLIVVRNNLGEEVLNLAERLIEDLDLLIIDSIAALVPMEETDKDLGEKRVASQARMMKEFFARCLPHLNKDRTGSRCALILVNHITEGIGGIIPVVNYPGGRAQKYYCSIILRVMRKGWEKVPTKSGLKKVGYDIVCRTEKNSLTTAYQSCSLPFSFDGTIDNVRAIIRVALDEGLIKQAGPYFEYYDVKEQGRAAFVAKIREREDLIERMKSEIEGTECETAGETREE
jgi:recombination protein RecA